MADTRPTPIAVGSGSAYLAARLAALRQKQKEAAGRDDWTTADAIEAQIRQLEAERAAAVQRGQ